MRSQGTVDRLLFNVPLVPYDNPNWPLGLIRNLVGRACEWHVLDQFRERIDPEAQRAGSHPAGAEFFMRGFAPDLLFYDRRMKEYRPIEVKGTKFGRELNVRPGQHERLHYTHGLYALVLYDEIDCNQPHTIMDNLREKSMTYLVEPKVLCAMFEESKFVEHWKDEGRGWGSYDWYKVKLGKHIRRRK
jgi:hypothetical protein